MMTVIRFLMGCGGIILIAANVNMIITAGPGYGTAESFLIIAFGAGVAASALCLPVALKHMPVVGVVLIAAMIGGESYLLLETVTRAIRDQAKLLAPAKQAIAAHEQATLRVADAKRHLDSLTSTPRTRAAVKALNAATAKAAADAALQTCARNCRMTHEDIIQEERLELTSARADLEQKRAAAQQRLEQAQNTLAAMPAPPAEDPAAAALGVEPWVIVVAFAASKALGANVLAIAMLILAGHMRSTPANIQDDRMTVAGWALRQYPPSPSGRVYLRDARSAYLQWCNNNGRDPCSPSAFAQELASLVDRSERLSAHRDNDGEVVIHGLAGNDNDNIKLIAA